MIEAENAKGCGNCGSPHKYLGTFGAVKCCHALTHCIKKSVAVPHWTPISAVTPDAWAVAEETEKPHEALFVIHPGLKQAFYLHGPGPLNLKIVDDFMGSLQVRGKPAVLLLPPGWTAEVVGVPPLQVLERPEGPGPHNGDFVYSVRPCTSEETAERMAAEEASPTPAGSRVVDTPAGADVLTNYGYRSLKTISAEEAVSTDCETCVHLVAVPGGEYAHKFCCQVCSTAAEAGKQALTEPPATECLYHLKREAQP